MFVVVVAWYLESMHSCSFANRMKVATPKTLSDREIFEGLELGDCWHDAGMLEIWDYLYNHTKTCVPDSWQDCMARFDIDLRASIGRWLWWLLGSTKYIYSSLVMFVCAYFVQLVEMISWRPCICLLFSLNFGTFGDQCLVRNGRKIPRNGRKIPQTGAKRKCVPNEILDFTWLSLVLSSFWLNWNMSFDSLACGVGLLRVGTTDSMDPACLQKQIQDCVWIHMSCSLDHADLLLFEFYFGNAIQHHCNV